MRDCGIRLAFGSGKIDSARRFDFRFLLAGFLVVAAKYGLVESGFSVVLLRLRVAVVPAVQD